MTARAALTTIEIIEDEGLVENAARVGAFALARLHDMKSEARADRRRARARASCSASSWSPRASAKTPAKDAAEAVMYRALDNGLSFKTTFGNVLTLTPPLTTTEAEMTRALDIIDEAIGAVAA